MSDAEVIIIGAGLAGLTCARRLYEAGKSCLVLEAADAVGGRIRTDTVDGFKLDRGFQVLLTAYPEARRWLDYKKLNLHAFAPGARVLTDEGVFMVADPMRQPGHLWSTLRAPVGTTADKIRVGALRLRVSRGSLEEIWQRPETTALQFFRECGFSEQMIDRFLRPWFSGIFLDRELATSSRMVEFVFRMFALGDAALPAGGMQAIPEQLASVLPQGSLKLNTPVAMLDNAGVRLESGEFLKAKQVVIAGDASRFLSSVEPVSWRATVAFYFSVSSDFSVGRMLCLNGTGKGRISSLVVPSEVAPGYAPAGKSLVCVSVIGDPTESDAHMVELIKQELRSAWGFDPHEWQLLKVMRVRHALPKHAGTGNVTPIRHGLWVCGDHRATPSTQGAMLSGRETAEAILRVT